MAGTDGFRPVHRLRGAHDKPCIRERVFGRLRDVGSGSLIVILRYDTEQIRLAHVGGGLKSLFGDEDTSMTTHGLSDANDLPTSERSIQGQLNRIATTNARNLFWQAGRTDHN